jgi:hypothetical protein
MMRMGDPMNASDMLDYALGQLVGPARDHAERELAADPAAADIVERLTQSVHRLLDDGATFEPLPGLSRRTLAFVAEYTSAPRRRMLLDFVPVTVPFRFADVAVAAGIFIAGLLTLLPAVQKSRERMEMAGCGYNLQQLGRALWQYGSRHHHYPFGPEQNTGAPVVSFVSMLHDSGLLTDSELESLDCPCSGSHRKHSPVPDFETLCRLQKDDPERVREVICTDYAYNVGHRHPAGHVVPITAVHTASVPLLADQPSHHNFRLALPGNSPNHGGRGQNVLYADLHVGWHNTRRLGPKDDDMFTNAHHQLAPGLTEDDNARLPSLFPFLGW